MTEIYEHKKHLYTIGTKIDDGFLVTKAKLLPTGQILVQEVRVLDVKNDIAVKRAIRTGKFDTFPTPY